MTEARVRDLRHALGVRPVYNTVDTCAAEFAAQTPYLYSTYDEETEVPYGDRPKVLILGCGTQPDRPGHRVRLRVRARLLRAVGGGLRDRHGQLQPRDGLHRLRHLRPALLRAAHPGGRPGGRRTPSSRPARSPGVIVQLGGQTPLGLAQSLKDAGVPIVGTSPESIHLAEERGAFGRVLAEAGLPAPQARHRGDRGRGPGDRRRDRLPGPGPALLRPRRRRHGDRLRRRDAELLHEQAPRGRPATTRC